MSNQSKRQVRASRAEEARFAAKIGGRRTARSGGYWGMPGDITAFKVLAEHKMTGERQLTIKLDWLKKIFNEAWATGRRPWLPFTLGGNNYVILDENEAIELRDAVLSSNADSRAEKGAPIPNKESPSCVCGGRGG